MKAASVYKIPNGKLVKISMEFERGTIKNISVFGDFFLHPEEGIEQIERALLGAKISEKELSVRISKTVEKNNLELFGIDAAGLARAIMIAKEGAQNG